ncbi:MAG TPA: FAD-dependent monooxygenase [Pedobacter sp.]|jgi:2-polyprenyl-6-methoxyphenol hydroxylase-like FAD-dependent oxidoreductase
MKSVLISGASIAGLTMAYWMKKYGYNVTVVEIGTALRLGGSPIDVRGEALDVANRMGILEQIKAAKLPTMGVEFLNGEGVLQGTSRVEDIGALRPGEDTEIRREDLAKILYNNAQEGIEYRFNNSIVGLVQNDEYVKATFKDGTIQHFDFVFGCDGIHSIVRKLAFGPEEQFTHFLNFYFSIFPVDGSLGKKHYGQMYTTPNHIALVYYYNDNIADGFLTFRAKETIDFDYRDAEANKQLIVENFKGVGWKAPQLIDAMLKSEAFYFDQGCQIKMPSWTNGRIAVIGDAGYAPAFPTGMGSTLAMCGATALADAMNENDEYLLAFKKYNESFRPTVKALQATVYDGLAFLMPDTQEAIDARNRGMQ